MPAGRYEVMDGDGNRVGTEDFRCAPGPAGWRYVADIETSVPEQHREHLDLVVDAAWRPIRCRIETGSHAILVEARGDRLEGERDGEPVSLPWGPATELDYLSPAFNAVTANRLEETSEIEVVYLDPVTVAPRSLGQRYEPLGDEEVTTPVGRFAARRWRYTALASGWTRDLWVAGDVLVRYDGVFELASYEPGASGARPV